jgi:E3 ubiquitin-protein ligase HUWE1
MTVDHKPSVEKMWTFSENAALSDKSLFDEMINQIRDLKKEQLTSYPVIRFQGNRAIDDGGVTKECFTRVSRFLNSNECEYFKCLESQETFFNPNQVGDERTGSVYRAIGRMVGICLHRTAFSKTKVHMPNLNILFFKILLNGTLRFEDFAHLDRKFYEQLLAIAIDGGVSKYDLTFPGERKDDVNDANFITYIVSIVQHALCRHLPLNQFVEGFVDVFGTSVSKINHFFSPSQLQTIVCGVSIGLSFVADLKENADYVKSDHRMVWFFEILEKFSSQDLTLFYNFTTALCVLPAGGISKLGESFKIDIDQTSVNKLPLSHTCYNQFVMPHYTSQDIMEKMILQAIRETRSLELS